LRTFERAFLLEERAYLLEERERERKRETFLAQRACIEGNL
jgi:hypothetical protein